MEMEVSNVIEVEGLKYVKIDYITYFGMVGIAGLLLYLGFFLHDFKTNVEVFQTDPFNRGMALHNFEECTCRQPSGKIWTSNGTAIRHTSKGADYYINSSFNLSDYLK